MATAKRLTMGVDGPSPSPAEERERIAVLRATVEKYLPEFAKGVMRLAAAPEDERSEIMMHQDGFAAGYDEDEYALLGMAVKYAGLHGVAVRFIGENHETF
jgi:hypothetical protein